MISCKICGYDDNFCIDLGSHYLSQAFRENTNKKGIEAPMFEYKLTRCNACGHLINNNFHPALMRCFSDAGADYDLRIRSNEPEHHFHKIKDFITSEISLAGRSRLLGITYKDKSLLNYLKSTNKNLTLNQYSLLEDTLQITLDLMNNDYTINPIKTGGYELILVRHFIEHVPEPKKLIENLLGCLHPNGALFIEVPSSDYIVKGVALGQIWEEHCHYFCARSLEALFNSLDVNFKIHIFDNGLEPIIGCLISKKHELIYNKTCLVESGFPEQDKNIFDEDNAIITERKILIESQLILHNMKRVILVGAGHIGIKNLLFLDLVKYVDFIVDDNPLKIGKISMSTELPIMPTEEINSNDVLVHSFSQVQIETSSRLAALFANSIRINLSMEA